MSVSHLFNTGILEDKDVKIVMDNPCAVPLKDCKSIFHPLVLKSVIQNQGLRGCNGPVGKLRSPSMLHGRWETTSPKPRRSKATSRTVRAKNQAPALPPRKRSIESNCAKGLVMPTRRESLEVRHHSITSQILLDAIDAVDTVEMDSDEGL